MTYKVIMPLLGETMEEGKLSPGLNKLAIRCKKGEILLEVESDKATLEVESFFSGYVRKILYPEDTEVKIGEVIALMTTTPDEAVEE